MKTIKLQKIKHDIKIGKKCGDIKPNILDNCLLEVDGEVIGFFIKDINEYSTKLFKLLQIANSEFRSDRVPKQEMMRGPRGTNADVLKRKLEGNERVVQYSTILGSRPPKPHMRLNYPSRSLVHNSKTAKTFIKCMLASALESENIIKQIAPQIHKKQIEIIEKNVPKKYRFGNMFTSSISNFNIAANYHRDTANLKGCVNVIMTKRNGATGGNLNVPDYDATFDSCDNSLLVYPAWKNIHGVTPINETKKGGYRNSLIFYPLSNFQNFF